MPYNRKISLFCSEVLINKYVVRVSDKDFASTACSSDIGQLFSYAVEDRSTHGITMFIAVDDRQKGQVAGWFVAAQEYARNMGDGQWLEKLVFVPVFHGDWASKFEKLEDGKEKGELLLEIERTDKDTCDKAWEQKNLDKIVITGLLPLAYIGIPKDDSGQPVESTQYSVPESLRQEIAARLAEKSHIPAADIYVANQIVPVRDVVATDGKKVWQDFNDQAETYFGHGPSFRISKYDTQDYDEDILNCPLYGIFVSACLHVPRSVSCDALEKFTDQFSTQFIDEKADRDLYRCIDEKMAPGGLSLLAPEQTQTMFASLTKKVKTAQKRQDSFWAKTKNFFFKSK